MFSPCFQWDYATEDARELGQEKKAADAKNIVKAHGGDDEWRVSCTSAASPEQFRRRRHRFQWSLRLQTKQVSSEVIEVPTVVSWLVQSEKSQQIRTE